jgi:hypothetical protein
MADPSERFGARSPRLGCWSHAPNPRRAVTTVSATSPRHLVVCMPWILLQHGTRKWHAGGFSRRFDPHQPRRRTEHSRAVPPKRARLATRQVVVDDRPGSDPEEAIVPLKQDIRPEAPSRGSHAATRCYDANVIRRSLDADAHSIDQWDAKSRRSMSDSCRRSFSYEPTRESEGRDA